MAQGPQFLADGCPGCVSTWDPGVLATESSWEGPGLRVSILGCEGCGAESWPLVCNYKEEKPET